MTTARPTPPRCHRAALWYGRRGLRVHPLRPGSKKPLLPEWQHLASTDGEMIAEWWSTRPDAGVAIATGTDSAVIVLDIDPRHGGSDSLDALVAEHGELPETWMVQTAEGGRHYYFRHPGGRVANAVGLWPGVDLRGDGGYVIAPPTELEGGHGYVWLGECGPLEVTLTAAPGWLLRRIRRREGEGEARPTDEWAALVRDGVDVGGRNHALARLAGYLFRCRPAPRVVLELLRAWSEARCRPPLEDAEIIRTVDSIARREAERRGEDADARNR